jgi:YHS domain-containing protein
MNERLGAESGRGGNELLIGGKEIPMEIDPVCGMEVDPKNAAGSHEYKGTTYYFCSTGCLEDFKEDPESYLK